LEIIILLRQLAVKPIVPTSATLANKNDVPLFSDPGIGVGVGIGNNIGTRSAGENEQGIGSDLKPHGMEDHNVQMDHPFFLSLTVFRDGECPSGNPSSCLRILFGFQNESGFEDFDVNRCSLPILRSLLFLTGNHGDRSRKDKSYTKSRYISFLIFHTAIFISKNVMGGKNEGKPAPISYFFSSLLNTCLVLLFSGSSFSDLLEFVMASFIRMASAS
jgi:hypothetical protein